MVHVLYMYSRNERWDEAGAAKSSFPLWPRLPLRPPRLRPASPPTGPRKPTPSSPSFEWSCLPLHPAAQPFRQPFSSISIWRPSTRSFWHGTTCIGGAVTGVSDGTMMLLPALNRCERPASRALSIPSWEATCILSTMSPTCHQSAATATPIRPQPTGSRGRHPPAIAHSRLHTSWRDPLRCFALLVSARSLTCVAVRKMEQLTSRRSNLAAATECPLPWYITLAPC